MFNLFFIRVLSYFALPNFLIYDECVDNFEKITSNFDFIEALDLYKNQEWSKAIDAFKASDELEEMFGGRKTNPSRIYIPRCEHYLENPPGEDWDGVWTLTSK